MGGKRPDQHNIDPGEAGSTDYKWRGEGRSLSEPLEDEQKRETKQTEIDDRRRMMNSHKTHAAPGMDAAQGRQVEKGTDEETRDRVDEASEESFPASDPPQQP